MCSRTEGLGELQLPCNTEKNVIDKITGIYAALSLCRAWATLVEGEGAGRVFLVNPTQFGKGGGKHNRNGFVFNIFACLSVRNIILSSYILKYWVSQT